MKKSKIFISLVLVLALVLAGCGKKDNKDQAVESLEKFIDAFKAYDIEKIKATVVGDSYHAFEDLEEMGVDEELSEHSKAIFKDLAVEEILNKEELEDGTVILTAKIRSKNFAPIIADVISAMFSAIDLESSEEEQEKAALESMLDAMKKDTEKISTEAKIRLVKDGGIYKVDLNDPTTNLNLFKAIAPGLDELGDIE